MGMIVKKVSIAFVGGGSALSAGLRGLLQENAARGDPLNGISIAVIEPRARLGVGAAWDTRHPLMLTNMTAATLRTYGAVDSSYSGFDIARARDLFDPESAAVSPSSYVSRMVVGERLEEYYAEIAPIAARSGIRVRHVRASATRISRIPAGFRIETSGGVVVEAGCVVLGLGLLSVDRFPDLAGIPGYHADPWAKSDLLETIGDGHRVAIAGLGPTAIDWALQLAERNLRHPVIAASPSGRLPAVRPSSSLVETAGLVDSTRLKEIGSRRPFSPDMVDLIVYAVLDRFHVTLDQLRGYCALSQGSPREILERTLAVCDEPQPVFEALKALDRLAPVIWQWSSEPGRARIMEKWARTHAQLSYAIPPSNGRALLAEINAGRLAIRGGLKSVRPSSGGRLELEFASARRSVTVDVLINATGFDGRLGEVNSPLVRALVEERLLHPARYGGAIVEYETGQALDAAGRRIDGLFVAGGSLTRSAAYVVNSLLGTSEQAIRVGMACARYLHARSGRAECAAAEGERWAFVI